MIAAFSITPLGVGDSVSESVAEAVALVRASGGLPNETNAMFTNVEGEWNEVMELVKACVMKVTDAAPRVTVVIKVDHRLGVHDALHAQVASSVDCRRRSGRGLSTPPAPSSGPAHHRRHRVLHWTDAPHRHLGVDRRCSSLR